MAMSHVSRCLLLLISGGLVPITVWAAGSWRDYTPQNRTPPTCPDYTTYAQTPHGPLSDGPLGLPDMRPSPECRTFNSSVVERVISYMEANLKDPDLARLFANTFPSTLDTTVKYFDPTLNLAFIITGDITAQWLRDTGNQFAHLYKLLPYDADLKALVKAVINTEARYIAQYPYCGSFQPPPESGLAPTVNDWATNVIVNPPVDNQTVFECKFELDSLAGFLKISRSYYENTRDSSFINDNWRAAITQILTVLRDQSRGSWSDDEEEDWEFVSYYNWTGVAGESLSPAVVNGGNGEPKAANGLVGSSHRPSDDLCVFNYITPANAMMSVELSNLAAMLTAIGTLPDVAGTAAAYSQTIRDAIFRHTVITTDDDGGGSIFAYETNGYGGQYIMDDANVPSLVSLPYLGFLNRTDPTYVRTKAAMFSRRNPYYAVGKQFSGIGEKSGPHVNATYPWPMSQISGIFGSDDDDEILQRLSLIVNNTDGLGLVHESIHISNASDYTRPWFAWANSYFAEMVLDLAGRKPGLILKNEKPYVIGSN
ncbi:Six-hairpin glycosidase-like protein [Diplogelasinospora grovesii]|uniref:Six-hairpin glycosidase-like protein n=1 Tax=Diplogelasinospora grovesii TaxID=303347 RepID=A0AAN6MWB0_9PEZI|nr:Six-hairpin glycosidase-like protein [Diplogelasinospora grovesii]